MPNISTDFTSKSETEAKVKTVTIAKDASQSNALDIQKAKNISIQMPAAWTTAQLSFLASDTFAGTYNPVYGMDNVEIVCEAAVSKFITFDVHASVFKTIRFLKFRSGVAALAVVQIEAREIKVCLKD